MQGTGLNIELVLTQLKQLRTLTGDDHGAQRVAFTPAWQAARAWFQEQLRGMPVEVHMDAAGNLWTTLRGGDERELLLGGHLDSVPNGGWLDGCLNVLAGLAVLRRLATQYDGRPPMTVRLVDWADEEGARFGKSLFGSSACSGTLDLTAARGLRDRAGVTLPDALRAVGIDFERVLESGRELRHAAAYLEFHIEQGPVLESMGRSLGAVTGTFGVERHVLTFTGRAAHAGSTPMAVRQDAFLAAARLAPELYRLTNEWGGVATIGSCETRPGIPTSVVAECRLTLDLRHLDPAALAALRDGAWSAAERFAREGGCTVVWSPLLRIAPVPFHPELIAGCQAAVTVITGHNPPRLPSGPLHDAAETARAGVPTGMRFVQSLGGVSHHPAEATREEHLREAVAALDRWTQATMGWILGWPAGGEPVTKEVV